MVYSEMVTGVVTEALDDALTKRARAKAEIDRLKSLIAACDAEIMAALDAEDDEFTRWVMEVTGEVQDYEKRKIRWQNGNDIYVVSKRKGSEPRKSISPEKLLAAGVPAHVIQKATTLGKPGQPSISIRKLVGKEESDDPED